MWYYVANQNTKKCETWYPSDESHSLIHNLIFEISHVYNQGRLLQPPPWILVFPTEFFFF